MPAAVAAALRSYQKQKIITTALLPVGFAIDRLEEDGIYKIRGSATPIGEELICTAQ